MRSITRSVAIGALVASVIALGTLPAAAAADPRASCVGTIVSSLAPQSTFDVNDFKALGDAAGADTFGQFVATGASLHLGSLQECVPQP